MKSGIILFFLLLIFGVEGFAQGRIGKWRSHLPYANASKLIIAREKVYCVTDGGLFCYNQSDNSIEKISKENGLSDTEISALGYSEQSGITVIAYGNANIDMIDNQTVTNIPDIMRYTQIMGDKRIYSIMFRENLAYLSTGFGIVVLDLESKEITGTYKIGEGGSQIKVNEMCSDGQFFYAATDQGIYKADINAINLQDYNYWTRITGIPNFNMKFNAIASIGSLVFASNKTGNPEGDIIYVWDGLSWNVFTGFTNDDCNYLSVWEGNLVISERYHVKVVTTGGEVIKQILIGSPKCAYRDKNSILWVADSDNGLIQNPDESTLNVISPNGPSTFFVSHIAISENILYTTPGGLNSSNNNQFRSGEVNVFKDNLWTSFKRREYKDFYRIVIDPTDPGHYFVGSWGYGLFEFQNDSLIDIYREENSSLQTILPGDFYRLGGLTYDTEGNLWVSNSSVAKPISVLKTNGEWQSYSLQNKLSSTIVTGDIIVSQSGYKWMILTSQTRGLLVMDDNGTIENADDDRYLVLDIKDENNSIITNDIYSIAEDREGNIWLGTNKGILVYYNPSGVFEGENFFAQQIIIPRNDDSGFGDALLGTESVTSIVVDGANRKWLGTKNAGVSLVSDDGLTQIHNFTAENSPLLSNSITSIAINDKNGEVYFGTDKGIISFVADATGPADNFHSVYIFPNPVRENFTGDIAISGLLENSLIKVTDLNGNLVFETISLGGQALWDGRNFRGERVRTGIYLVFCSSEDGTLSHVTKLLFIH
jgi:hypothetical protein